MFGYRISKQNHFGGACRIFALHHSMAKLAERAGTNVQTLRNKRNPEQLHQLTAPDIWLLTCKHTFVTHETSVRSVCRLQKIGAAPTTSKV